MNISYSQISDYCNELHTLAKNMKDTLENVTNISSKLQNKEAWSGNAANHYAEKIHAVTSKFEEIFIELENSILFLASCAEGYKAIDENVIREICSNLKITEPNLNTSSIFK